MIHGLMWFGYPPGSLHEGSNCSKHCPKSFCDETGIAENGFVKYRRTKDGRRIIVNGKELDDCWVVHYNRDLCVKYDAQINVERCAQKRLLNTSTNTCIRVQTKPHLSLKAMSTLQMQEDTLSIGKLMR